MKPPSIVAGALLLVLVPAPRTAAVPVLADPSVGTLELVTPSSEAATLDKIDGLGFDAYGNLLGVREVTGTGGGLVWIDKTTGAATTLVAGIARADQIALVSGGHLKLTSEVTPASETDRLFDVQIGYDAGQVPDAGTTSVTSLTTSLPIDNPEGLAILDVDGPYGSVGDAFVCEDRSPGRVLRVSPAGRTTVLASGLERPEGAAFGDFGGAAVAALYVAETSTHRIVRVDASGAISTVGVPSDVSLNSPDNVEFGPDGFLYVTEDRPAPSSRVIRIAPDGTHEVFATGFGQAQGMIFDSNGDFYVAEQDSDRVWRVIFEPPTAVDPPVVSSVDRLGLTVRGSGTARPSFVYSIPAGAVGRPLRLDVYDVSGRRVRGLLDGRATRGSHSVSWGDAGSAGVYFARLRAGEEVVAARVTVVR